MRLGLHKWERTKTKILHKCLHSKAITLLYSFTLLPLLQGEEPCRQISHLSYMDAQNYDFGDLRVCPSKVYIFNSGRVQHSEATASTDMSWMKEWQETGRSDEISPMNHWKSMKSEATNSRCKDRDKKCVEMYEGRVGRV